MKMAKADKKDIEAASDALSILDAILSGYYPDYQDDLAPTFFDAEDPTHLLKFYELMKASLEKSPGWPGRIIGGMCYVILYDKNEIVDPDADTLELHPKFVRLLDQRQPLTDEQIMGIAEERFGRWDGEHLLLARAIERAHGIERIEI